MLQSQAAADHAKCLGLSLSVLQLACHRTLQALQYTTQKFLLWALLHEDEDGESNLPLHRQVRKGKAWLSDQVPQHWLGSKRRSDLAHVLPLHAQFYELGQTLGLESSIGAQCFTM